MKYYYLLFRQLEKRQFLPGSEVRTRQIFDGLMDHMKEEIARKVVEILDESETEKEYRDRMGREFEKFRR